jgi:hypothetical protein
LKLPLRSLASSTVLVPSLYVQESYAASKEHYTHESSTAIGVLNSEWYNSKTGFWDGAWWQSANAITTLADFALLEPNTAKELPIARIVSNSIRKA